MNPGLCNTCAWVRKIENDRGSTFYHCGKSREDASFPKYPRLPVLHCRGFKSIAPLQSGASAPPDPS